MCVCVCCYLTVVNMTRIKRYSLVGESSSGSRYIPSIPEFLNMPSSTYSLTYSLQTYPSIYPFLLITQRSSYVFAVFKLSSNECAVPSHLTVLLFPYSPDAWTSVTYCSSSCPWWMTSKVRLFIVSALSAWCCSLCSASVRSSVSKSLICWDSSSFHDSRSEMIWEGDGKSETKRNVNSQIMWEKNYFLIIPEKDWETMEKLILLI